MQHLFDRVCFITPFSYEKEVVGILVFLPFQGGHTC